MNLTITHSSVLKKGTKQTISDKEIVTIGRKIENDFVFDSTENQQVSGYHAEIRNIDNQPYLIDLKSTNGTYLNNKKITKHSIYSGDNVQLGNNGSGFIVEFNQTKPLISNLKNSDLKKQTIPPKLYGKKTMGLLIDQALKTIGKSSEKGTSKSTDYFEALMNKKVSRNSRKMKQISIVAILFTIMASLGLSYYIYTKPAVTNVYSTTQVVSDTNIGGTIAYANRSNVFMIAGIKKQKTSAAVTQNTALEGFCTAFAIGPSVLATNAHCLKVAQEKFTYIYVLMNGSPDNRYSVTKMVAHPGYNDNTISPDVALLKINTQLSSWVAMAANEELATVATGITMYIYGFPGRLNNEQTPEATFVKGDIGRVTTFSQHLGYFGENTLLQHSAFCTSGTSGSPIFNANGHVIGINAGGYVEGGQALSGYNFGMRIDLINSLISAI